MARVILVCGPPCAGKTYWAEQHRQPGDQVLDQDVMGRAAYERALRQLPHHHGTVYVIRCLATAWRRAEFAEQLGAVRTVLLLEPTEVLMERARMRPNPARHMQAVRKWLEQERGVTPVSSRTDPPPRVSGWWVSST